MPILYNDLNIYTTLTGKQILELFFRDTINKSVDEFVEWATVAWISREIIMRGYPSISGRGVNWFKNCEFDRDAFCYWIEDKNIISKLQDREIKIEKGLIKAIEKYSMKYRAEKNLPLEAEPTIEPIEQNQKDSPVDDRDFPPNLQNWGQVTFCVLDSSELEITVKGKPFKGDVLIANKMLKYLYSLLFNIVLKNGIFDKYSFHDLKLKNISSYVARLNLHLSRSFKINESPIAYNRKAKTYQSAFKTKSDLKQEILSPEDNTPAGVPPPKTKSAKNFDSYQ